MSIDETALPLGEPTTSWPLPHFPTLHQAVIWRNWSLVRPSRLARTLQSSVAEVTAAAEELGCGGPASAELERLWLTRGYITLIRQNWHLLPYHQILALLDWTPQQLEFALQEDDFLFNKLGRSKPRTPTVRLTPLSDAQRQRTQEMRATLSRHGAGPTLAAAQPFDFLRAFESSPPRPIMPAPSRFNLKLAYSFAAVYGDPLLDERLNPYPDGLLARLAESGVNAVWLQGTLYTLTPWFGDTQRARGGQQRLDNLNRLTERAARFGIGVYLYLNEPRAMKAEVFASFPDWRGAEVPAQELHCFCLGNASMRQALQEGVTSVFRQASGLAGALTISMSENVTHCRSKRGNGPCPRCQPMPLGELIALENNTIAQGVFAARPDADVIVWDWAWPPQDALVAIDHLDRRVRLMCTSEAYLPTDAMGVQGVVSDYSISKVGPGPVATANWHRARDRGIQTLAKVQLNNSWECSAVPYLPVPFLVKRHLRNLEREGIRGLMVSWTLGGYPGGNLSLTDLEPLELAERQFGPALAPIVLEAWRRFSDAFEHFPLHATPCLYTGPQNYGPMTLLCPQPSGRKATMVGFPYDDLDLWRGRHFPPHVFEEQFRKLSEQWRDGLTLLQDALPSTAGHEIFQELHRIALTAWCHFRSAYHQICYVRLREQAGQQQQLIELLDAEIRLACLLLGVVREDSRIGFEASNHYYYTEASLQDKILNCEYLKSYHRDRQAIAT